jgi:AsmA family protein
VIRPAWERRLLPQKIVENRWKITARRGLVVFATLVGVLAIILVAAMVAVQSGWAEQRIERLAAERIGREVDVDGMRMLASWPPQVEVGVLRVANPDWAQDRYLVDARGMRATLEIAPLLRGRIIGTAAVDEAAVALEKDAERTTWTFPKDEAAKPKEGEARPYELRSLSIGEARVAYRDKPDETELHVRVSGDLGRAGRPFEMRGEGRVRGEAVQAKASAPAVPLASDQPVELTFEVLLAKTRTGGTLSLRAGAQGLQSIRGRIEASGPSVAAFKKITRLDLPSSAPYRVSAQVLYEDGRFSAEDLKLKLGKSDVRGLVFLDTSRERPFVRADLESDYFDLRETGIKEEVKEKLEEQYLFPREPWASDKLNALDAEVRLRAKRIRNARPVPLDAIDVRVVLENAKLNVEPLTVSLASGTIRGRIAFDASESPESASVSLDMRGLRLSRLVPSLKEAESALGLLNGRLQLSGRGDTPATLLGSSNGQILFAARGGQASALLVEILGLDAAEAVTLLGKKHMKQPLKCAVLNFEVKNGTAKTAPFVIDATDTVLVVEGTLRLGEEKINLTARAEPRDASPFTLRTPAEITGTFLDPQIKPRKGPLVARGAAALALAAVNPLLAIIPFVDPGGDPEAGCPPQKPQKK